MSKKPIDEDRLNLEIRKFLKRVGITSQREIEAAVRTAFESGALEDTDNVSASITLEVPALKLKHIVEQDIGVR